MTKTRAEYVTKIAKSSPMFLQYIYTSEKRLAVMRLPSKLAPSDAKKWEALLQSL